MNWGLVTDVREDGTTYNRHGIIVNLTVNLTVSGTVNTIVLQRLRCAIDLVKLALVVDPSAIKSLMSGDITIEGVDIDKLASGDAPFEVRVSLQVQVTQSYYLQDVLATRFMKELDQERVEDSDILRHYLASQVRQSVGTRRLTQLPVRATLTLTPQRGSEGPDVSFFKYVSTTSKALQQYQHHRDSSWLMKEHHAQLKIDTVYLRLGPTPLHANVLKKASALKNKGLGVSSSSVTLDIETMPCDEQDLQAFLDSVGAIYINTSRVGYTRRPRRGDEPNLRMKILMMLRCVGQTSRMVTMDLSGLFALCETRENRRAIIHGLVHFLLPRSPTASLSVIDYAQFTATDARDLQEEVDTWPASWPATSTRVA